MPHLCARSLAASLASRCSEMRFSDSTSLWSTGEQRQISQHEPDSQPLGALQNRCLIAAMMNIHHSLPLLLSAQLLSCSNLLAHLAMILSSDCLLASPSSAASSCISSRLSSMLMRRLAPSPPAGMALLTPLGGPEDRQAVQRAHVDGLISTGDMKLS